MAVLGFVIVAPVIVFGTVTVLAFLFFGMVIVRPWMAEQFEGKSPWWKKLTGLALKWVSRKIKAVELRLTSELGGHFAQMSPGVSRWLHNHAKAFEQLSGVIVASNQATYNALSTLRRTTVPGLIARAIAPINATLTRHTNRLDALEDLNRRVSVVIGNGLRGLPWGVPGSYVNNFQAWWNTYAHLWQQFFGVVQPRVTQLWNERVVNLRNIIQSLQHTVEQIQTVGLPAIRARITELERGVATILDDPSTWVITMLGLALVPQLSPASIRAALGSLFCRNTQTVARNICQMDEAMLAQLLAGTLLFALVLDPRVIARIGQEITEGMTDIWRATALQ